MSYPQPSSNAAVTGGQNIFRLQTSLVSPGDIYQSEQSAFAVAVGPNSDIANVLVNYYDETAPGFMNSLLVGSRTPFSGLVLAQNDKVYKPSGLPGRILFSVADFIPQIPSAQADQIVPPVLDLIQYLSPPPVGIPTVRNDRNLYFQDYPTGGASYRLMIPYYGRVFASLLFGQSAGGESVKVEGCNFFDAISQTPTTLVPVTALAAGNVSKIVKSSVDGMFDYLRITISGGTGINIRTFVKLSDTPQ
jgi:hypothetical protein